MTLNVGSTKQLKWMYGARKSKLFEVCDTSVYNRLIATVEHVGTAFVITRQHKTDLATDEHIQEHCDGTLRSMELWLADEIAKKLT